MTLLTMMMMLLVMMVLIGVLTSAVTHADNSKLCTAATRTGKLLGWAQRCDAAKFCYIIKLVLKL